MGEKPRGVPDNSPVVMPRLFCRDLRAEIDFCKEAFGAIEVASRPGPDGRLAHGAISIGPAMIMLEAEWPSLPSRAPVPDGSSPVVIFVYVEDVDKTIERAVALGASVLVPVSNQFWGDRMGWIMDPAGHVWTVATRMEVTTEEERAGRWSKILESDDSQHSDT